MLILKLAYRGTDDINKADWAQFECKDEGSAERLRDALVEAGFMTVWDGKYLVRASERDSGI